MSAEFQQCTIPDFEDGSEPLGQPVFLGEQSHITFTRPEHDALISGMQSAPRREHSDYVNDGEYLLETARISERIGNRLAAADQYRQASTQFLGALGSEPLVSVKLSDKSERLEVPAINPIVLLQYARCLSKQVELGAVEPYREPETVSGQIQSIVQDYDWGSDKPPVFHMNRRDTLQRIADESFKTAWQLIKEAPAPNDTTVFAGAIVIAESLQRAHHVPEAEIILDEATEVLSKEDTDPKLHNFLEKSTHEKLARSHDLVDRALSDMMHSSESVLALL